MGCGVLIMFAGAWLPGHLQTILSFTTSGSTLERFDQVDWDSCGCFEPKRLLRNSLIVFMVSKIVENVHIFRVPLGIVSSSCILMGVDFGFILKPLDQPLTDRHWPLWDLYTSYFATNGASWYISLFPNPVGSNETMSLPLMNTFKQSSCTDFNSCLLVFLLLFVSL